MEKAGITGDISAENNFIHHFVNLLESEAGVYEKYIDLAIKEKEAIAKGEDEKLKDYLEYESACLKEAGSYDAVISTFDKLLKSNVCVPVKEIDNLKLRVSSLHMRLCALNRENRKALQEKMETIKNEMEAVSKRKSGKGLSFKKQGQPRYIDTDA